MPINCVIYGKNQSVSDVRNKFLNVERLSQSKGELSKNNSIWGNFYRHTYISKCVFNITFVSTLFKNNSFLG